MGVGCSLRMVAAYTPHISRGKRAEARGKERKEVLEGKRHTTRAIAARSIPCAATVVVVVVVVEWREPISKPAAL